jgi:hypothetical protein
MDDTPLFALPSPVDGPGHGPSHLEGTDTQGVTVGQDQSRLEAMGEFPHVAGPWPRLQKVPSLIRQRQSVAPVPSLVNLKKTASQQGNVFPPFPEGREP